MKQNCSTDVTIIIKTFEREKALIGLLQSIRLLGYTYPIIVADDSKEPYKDNIIGLFPDLDISYHVLPFDSGLSYGRNYLLEHTHTKYFVLCDDDFYFDKNTDIEKARAILIREDVDILSGLLYNYLKVRGDNEGFLPKLQKALGLGTVQTYVGNINRQGKHVTATIRTRVREEFVKSDLVHNFFIGKTGEIRKIGGWDPTLKLSEHAEFFLRAKSCNLKVGHSGVWSTRHYPILLKGYQSFRKRDFDLDLFNKYELDSWIDIVDNGSTFIRERENGKITLKRVFHKNLRGLLRFLYNKLRK
ncbi:MAG: glycosyltransferase family 2 protein [Clostridia bacterium]|nr:glycosyltransferase family 2 protein [Clostridia bacterium]